MMRMGLVLVVMFVAACGASTANGAETNEPDEGTTEPAPSATAECGWREGSASACTSDADCGPDQRCVTGQGNEIVPEREDGVETMPPYERETVQYCESTTCESAASPEPEPEPEPEPG